MKIDDVWDTNDMAALMQMYIRLNGQLNQLKAVHDAACKRNDILEQQEEKLKAEARHADWRIAWLEEHVKELKAKVESIKEAPNESV